MLRAGRSRYRVFFSHSNRDRWIATQCVRLIEQAGEGAAEVFLDEKHFDAGQSIPDSLRKNIAKGDDFVVLLSPNSKGSAVGKREEMSRIKHDSNPQRPLRVFVSHSGSVDDTAFARKLKRLLSQRLDARVFSADNLNAGGK